MTITPPGPNWDSSPVVGICINEEWATFVSGLLARGEAEEYWSSDQIRGAQGIMAIQEALFGICGGGGIVAGSLVIASHAPASGTDGGAVALGLTQIPLTTLAGLDLTGFSLAANTVTIPSGSYEFFAWHIFERLAVNYGARPIVRFLSPTVDHWGGCCFLYIAGNQVNGFIAGSFVTAGQTQVQLLVNSSAASANGRELGSALSMGQPELFGQLALRKMA